MTLRLYYHDATLREFTARLICRRVVCGEDGIAAAVALDQTAFYPTSGGQPHDTGRLNGASVVDIQEDAEGTIWHLLAEPLAADTALVRGQIDWSRRFEHMQQHTGQHLLSAAFVTRLSALTVGFHLGRETSTIDLDVADLDWQTASEIEWAANAVVWQNRPVTHQIVAAHEAAKLPLRKPPVVEGRIRVIEIAGYDVSACGGTHVAATGEIGLLKITAIERYKSGVRVTFLCGGRALKAYQQSLHWMRASSAALSVGPGDLPAAIARLEEGVKAAQRDLRQSRATLAAYEAEALWAEAALVGEARIIVAQWQDRDPSELRGLAGRLRDRPRTLALLATTGEEGVRIICACSTDLAVLNASEILRAALKPLGGRGGGTPELAQGGASEHTPETVSDALQEAVARYVGSSESDLLSDSDCVR